MTVPKYTELMNPILRCLRDLGGSASIQEMEDRIAEMLNLSENDVTRAHKTNRTLLGCNLAWARTYLRVFGLLENSARGVWALTPKGRTTPEVDPKEVHRFVQNIQRTRPPRKSRKERKVITEIETEDAWKDTLLEVLKKMDPSAFEKLCQRFLRESGFVEVEVTGHSGDGGIDGRGLLKIGSLISFRVGFQSKRYKGSVSPSVVREFQGAITGRAERGLLITTGTFSKDARTEAQRDGAIKIDLIDGEELVERLKELGLGVSVKAEMQETVEIDAEWFQGL